jgi:hypothetical protein
MCLAYRYVNGILDILASFLYRPHMRKNDPRIITPMSQELIEAIDDYRYANRLPSRDEAIRSLIELGLAAEKTEQKVKA